jgi:hypothetical protein
VLVSAPDPVQEFRERTERKIRDLRCPDHRQPPRLKFKGATLRDVTIQMSACCNKLIDLANRAITEPSEPVQAVVPVQAAGPVQAPAVVPVPADLASQEI